MEQILCGKHDKNDLFSLIATGIHKFAKLTLPQITFSLCDDSFPVLVLKCLHVCSFQFALSLRSRRTKRKFEEKIGI